MHILIQNQIHVLQVAEAYLVMKVTGLAGAAGPSEKMQGHLRGDSGEAQEYPIPVMAEQPAPDHPVQDLLETAGKGDYHGSITFEGG